jgi:hypothetical protein
MWQAALAEVAHRARLEAVFRVGWIRHTESTLAT